MRVGGTGFGRRVELDRATDSIGDVAEMAKRTRQVAFENVGVEELGVASLEPTRRGPDFIKEAQGFGPKLLHADILEGHLSSSLCHLGNVAYE